MEIAPFKVRSARQPKGKIVQLNFALLVFLNIIAESVMRIMLLRKGPKMLKILIDVFRGPRIV